MKWIGEKWLERIAHGLATPHLAELGLSAHATAWGLAQLVTFGATIVPAALAYPYTVHSLAPMVYGLWPFVTGAIGVWAVWRRKRFWRMASSLCILPCWGLLSLLYSTFEPPLVGGLVTYSVAAFGEFIVFLRVKYRFDRWGEIEIK